MAVKKSVVVLLLLLMISVGHCNCYDGSGRIRPTASEDLPIVDLIESPNRMYDPKSTDIDEDILMERLGDFFDSRFMSVTNVSSAEEDQLSDYVRNKKGMLVPIGKIPKFVRKFVRKFVQVPPALLDRDSNSFAKNSFKFLRLPGEGRRNKASERLRRKLRHFLWAYVFCPVRYTWKDLGVRFWPRWLREGHCFDSVRSCSFPEGMRCLPSKNIGKTVLRWHCQDWDRSRYCKWIPVRYPVITACACSC